MRNLGARVALLDDLGAVTTDDAESGRGVRGLRRDGVRHTLNSSVRVGMERPPVLALRSKGPAGFLFAGLRFGRRDDARDGLSVSNDRVGLSAEEVGKDLTEFPRDFTRENFDVGFRLGRHRGRGNGFPER